MRLPRFRVRTLMFAVGVVALLVWGAMMGTRSYVYYSRVKYYDLEERDGGKAMPSVASRWNFVRCASITSQLSGNYRRAMWCPWFPVALISRTRV